MRKIINVFCVVALVSVLSACNNKDTVVESIQSKFSKSSRHAVQQSDNISKLIKKPQNTSGSIKIQDTESSRVFDGSIFPVDEAKAGDFVCSMKIESVDSAVDKNKIFVRLSGELTLSGQYMLINNADAAKKVIVFEPDAAYDLKLPRLEQDKGRAWFYLENIDDAFNYLCDISNSGKATIVIDGYAMNFADNEVKNSAKLMKVISKTSDKTSSKKIDEKAVVQDLIDCINYGYYETLMQYVDPEAFPSGADAAVDTAVSYYRIYFSPGKVVKFDDLGVLKGVKYKNSESVKQYRLFSENGIYKDIKVVRDKNQKFIIDDRFFFHSKEVKDYAEKYTAALRQKNRQLLPSMLHTSKAGKKYTEDTTEMILTNYEKYFECNTLECWYSGRMESKNGDGGFVFEITGKRDGLIKHHEIMIICGDGKIGITDEWTPEEKDEIKRNGNLDSTSYNG